MRELLLNLLRLVLTKGLHKKSVLEGKKIETRSFVILRILQFILLQVVLVNCFSFNTFKVFDVPTKSIELLELQVQGMDRDKILVISIDGVISDRGSSEGFGLAPKESLVARVKEELMKAYGDSEIRGIILKINSPGGGVTASDILYKEIMSFKMAKKIPVVALFMDTAASGGYYIAMASDKIVAHPTTVTGSIGVIISGVNVKKGLDKLGIEDQSIVSGGNKNILSPLTDFKKEQRDLIQQIVNDLYERFFRIVQKGRPLLDESKLRVLADGRIFSASQAKQEGLVDEVGYFEDAIAQVKIASAKSGPGISQNPRIITYSQYKKNIKNIYQISEEFNGNPQNILNQILDSIGHRTESGFMYMWIY